MSAVDAAPTTEPTAPSASVPVPPRPRRPAAPRRGVGDQRLLPYALLLPAMLITGAVLAYPLGKLVALSLQRYGLEQLFAGKGSFIGLDNYTALLGDDLFWQVVGRTLVFTVVNVVLTMGLGLLLALLLQRLRRGIRIALTTALVGAWAMPMIVSVAVFQWMVDYDFGVVNWLLTRTGLANLEQHNWFEDPKQGFVVIIALIVWQALPFVALTLHAALTQVPAELDEAARIDGAGALQVFRNVTFPVIRPVFVILTSLSLIWDFQVFNQVWVMLGGRVPKDYYLLSVYSYVESFGVSNYGRGAAIALVMVLMLLVVTFFYVRQLLRIGEVR